MQCVPHSFSIISKHFIDSYEILISTCISRLSLNWIHRPIEFIYSINDTASEQIKEIFLRGFSYRQKLNNSIPYNLILESE